MQGYFHRVNAQTPTRFWINNVTQREAELAIEAGACGCTQNPAYVWKMLNHAEGGAHARALMQRFMAEYADDNQVEVALQRALVGEIAQIFLPIYEKTAGRWGYVSIQGDPFHEDCETIVRMARYNREAGPNITAKIPVTEEGLRAIEILAAEGTPINATEVMSVRQAMDVYEVWDRVTAGMTHKPVIYFSHIAGIFDEYIRDYAARIGADVPQDYLWQAGVTVAKKIDQLMRETGNPLGFISGGARGLQHFTEMVGCDCVVTINWQGTADKLIEMDPPVVQRFLRPTPHSVIDTLCERLPAFRKAYEYGAIQPEEYEEYGPVVRFRTSFEDAWRNTLEMIRASR